MQLRSFNESLHGPDLPLDSRWGTGDNVAPTHKGRFELFCLVTESEQHTDKAIKDAW
jgi:hypothetical protein